MNFLKQPKGHLVIAVPCYDKPHIQFSQSLATMMYRLGVFKYPTAIVHQSSTIVAKCRNMVIDFIETQLEGKEGKKIEHIFWCDADMSMPADTPLRLLAHQKDIVGCTYLRRTPPYEPLGKTLANEKTDTSKLTESLLEMGHMPTGCLLTHRDVFRKLRRPYFRHEYVEETAIGKHDEWEVGEDYTFSQRARDAGFKLWLDVALSTQIGHVSEKVIFPDGEKPDVRAA
jgi:hypothetical protein